jgi:hypothetical protein
VEQLLAHSFKGFSLSWWGGCGRVAQITLWQPGGRERKSLHYLFFSIFPFLSILALNLWLLPPHSGGLPPLVNTLEVPHRYTQWYASIISLMLINPIKLILKISQLQ